MGWNGAAGANGVPAKPLAEKPTAPRGGLPPSLVKGLVAGLVVIVGALVAFFLLSGGDAKKPSRDATKKTKMIKTVASAAAPTNVVGAVAETNAVWKPPKDSYRDARGVLRHKGGARVYDPTKKGRVVNIRRKDAKNSPFEYRSENEIMRYITLRPGQALFGTRRYDEAFEEDFMESLKHPIIVTEKDSERDKMLKKLMIETKIEICDRLKAGEKLKDILEAERSEVHRAMEMQRMAKRELMEQLDKENLSPQDVDTYVEAINGYLEKNGVSKLKNTSILKRNLLYNNANGKKKVESNHEN